MTDSNAENRLAEALRKARREALPERDLWPGITHALHVPVRPAWHRQSALAASIVLVLAMSLYFGSQQPLPAVGNAQLDAFLATLRNEHQLSKEALLVQYRDQEAFYPGWQVQMQQLEQAEQAIYRALQEDPGNLELLKILRQVQTRQMQLIDAVFNPRLNTI